MISTTSVPHVQKLLKNVAKQKDEILKVINAIDASFLVRSDPRWMEEHKLRIKIMELQCKFLAMGEEVHLMKVKNAQVEHQLARKVQSRGTYLSDNIAQKSLKK